MRETRIYAVKITDSWTPELKNNIYKTLNAIEVKKAESFHFEDDKRRSLLGRYFLRKLLSQYLNVSASEIVIRNGKYGKPEYFTIGNKPVYFNISYADNWIAAAISTEGFVGLDIEKKQKLEKHLIQYCLTKTEQSLLEKLTRNDQKDFFYKAWTAKEAFAKALGFGLNINFSDIEVRFTNKNFFVDCKKYLNEQKWRGRSYDLENRYICSVFAFMEKLPVQINIIKIS